MDRIVEIATDNVHLAAHRGLLIVTLDRDEIGRVALDDIVAVLGSRTGDMRISFASTASHAGANAKIPASLPCFDPAEESFAVPDAAQIRSYSTI